MSVRTHTFNGRRYTVEIEHRLKGWCDTPDEKDEYTIYIDPELGVKDFLEVAIHEAIHALKPELSEEGVDSLSVPLSRWLWRLGYRRSVQD